MLDNQLCFLLYATSRAVTATYRPVLTKLGLTYPQYLVLMVLWEQDGLRLNEIGGRLHLDSGTLTPLLRRMERDGFIRSRRDASDGRHIRIRLTAKGRSTEARAGVVPQALMGKLTVPIEQVRQLRAELRILLQRILPE